MRRIVVLLGALTLTACATVSDTVSGVTDRFRREEAPEIGQAPRRTAEPDPNARGIARVELAGRELVRQYRARLVDEEPSYEADERRAIRAALAADTERCSDEYAALPLGSDDLGGPEEGRIAVYLVPLTDTASALPIGGFSRVLVDAESGEVIEAQPLTEGCLSLSIRPEDRATEDRVRSLYVTHRGTPYPQENHVFASSTAAVDLIVTTGDRTYRVSDGQVRSLD